METPQNKTQQAFIVVIKITISLLVFILTFIGTGFALAHIFPLPVREDALRAVCHTRLKGISTALELYAQCESRPTEEEWESEPIPYYPPSLDAMVREGYISEKNFTCPSAKQRAPWGTTLFRDYVHCLYSQRKEPLDSLHGYWEKLIILYEIPLNHYQEIATVLFPDGHVESVGDMDEFRRKVQAVNDFISEEGKQR